VPGRRIEQCRGATRAPPRGGALHTSILFFLFIKRNTVMQKFKKPSTLSELELLINQFILDYLQYKKEIPEGSGQFSFSQSDLHNMILNFDAIKFE
jgi:hypothetical protein